MRASTVFSSLFTFFLPPAIIATLILYFYAPLFACSFPDAKPAVAGCMIPGQEKEGVDAQPAPFRLLALADPQLEGDSSLPDPHAELFPSLERLERHVRVGGISTIPVALPHAVAELVVEDLWNILLGYRKRLDLWGNDLYLAHIYRSVSWWSNPTHTVVLGDLLGSQHVSDAEFERRSNRFWGSVFKKGKKVPHSVTDVTGRSEILGHDLSWKNRIIAVAGNHDIGYPGDITKHRLHRFEEKFGSVNWDIRFTVENESSASTAPTGFSAFQLPTHPPPELRLIILNSMNLDSPAKDPELQQQSRDFADALHHHNPSAHPHNTATVLLTHIPLHKENGICTDSTFFDWMPAHQGGGIKEQNHLSRETSVHLLNGLAKSSNAIVLNGHDHTGCDTYHYRSKTENEAPHGEWKAIPHLFSAAERADSSNFQGIRELTVRSMMGEFGGNALFLSGWFDDEMQEWRFESNTCALGVQHFWWGVHVFDLVVLGLGVLALVAELWEIRQEVRKENAGGKAKKE